MNKLYLGLIFLPSFLTAFDEKPWFDDLWLFHLESGLTYTHFPNVQGATVQFQDPANVYLIKLNTGVSPLAYFDLQMEVEFADTPKENLGLRSGAVMGRVLWLDDVVGDPISWSTGLSIRGVSTQANHDVTSPYHSYLNFELHSAIGKEWSSWGKWRQRMFGTLAIGMANQGFPWVRALYEYAYHFGGHSLSFFTTGYVGCGGQQHVDVNHFYGWGVYQHRSLDLGLIYRYEFPIWGKIEISYDRRVFARNFPQHCDNFLIAYRLPFSLI